jgi:hypothetical protein
VRSVVPHSTPVAATPQLLLQLADGALEGGAEVGPVGLGMNGGSRAAAGDRHPVGRLGLTGVRLVAHLDLIPGHAGVEAFEVPQPGAELLSIETDHFSVATGYNDFWFGTDDGASVALSTVLVPRARAAAGPVASLSTDRHSREAVHAPSSPRRTAWR